MANKKKNKKNKKNKKKNPISNTPPSPQSMVKPTSDSQQSSPLSPRPPLPPVFFRNTVLIKSNDMSYKMKYEAFDIVDNAFKKHLLKDKEAAEEIKKEFDKRHGPHWHCIIGASYGLYINYRPKCHIFFYMSLRSVLLFKYG
ncbi:unnamed protein product [Vicia faba]|uniref:Dynein light chain n=1 Tax=Vicia faba TaxID=3906 RepID=A0AAV0YWF0_VICFA|nr:unnamed protein product [Vicia faba]